MIEKRIYKKRHPKYKTEEERREALRQDQKRFRERNPEYNRKKYLKQLKLEDRVRRTYIKRNYPPPETLPPGIEARLSNLEKENKDILADLEECLKENRELKNLIKWGNRKISKF